MREIKFRAFEKSANSMINDFHIKDCFQSVLTGENEYSYDYEIMQYTGLKDKNGVEIYEGDLLIVRTVRVCEVIFHKEAGCWDLLPRNIISSGDIGAISPSSYQYHTEIIGNIHSNPELLKAKNNDKLSVISGELKYWLDLTIRQRADENLNNDDDCFMEDYPVKPTIGVIKNWIYALDESSNKQIIHALDHLMTHIDPRTKWLSDDEILLEIEEIKKQYQEGE